MAQPKAPKPPKERKKKTWTPASLAAWEANKIKPGEVRNPLGARAHDPAKKALKKLTTELFQDIIQMALDSDRVALRAVINDQSTPALKVGVAKALYNAIKRGDWGTLRSIIEQITGKQVIKVDHTTNGAALPAATAQTTAVHLYLPHNGRTKEENENGNLPDPESSELPPTDQPSAIGEDS